MRTRSLILGTLLLAVPASAQEAGEKAASCCAATDGPQVVQVQRARPASLSQQAVPVALVAADRGYLGVRLASDEEGMRILEVIPGSGAAEAGLQAGDRILTVAGTSTAEAAAQEALQGLEAGETVKITYDRGGETRKAKVTLKTLAQMEVGLEEEPEEILEEPPAIEETPEIEWIENVEQDLAEEIAGLDVNVSDFFVSSGEGQGAATELPPAADADDRGYLGVSLDTSADGLTILEVYAGSGAQKSGLRPGDVILQFDGRKGGAEDQLAYMRGKKVGDEVQVRYRRGGDVGRAKIALGPLRNGGVTGLGFAQVAPGELERVRLAPDIQWDTRETPLRTTPFDSKQIQEIIRRATEESDGAEGGVADVWITTVGPEGGKKILRGGDSQGRVQFFTTSDGHQVRVEAVIREDDHDEDEEHEHGEHEHEHGEHEHEHGEHEHDGHEQIEEFMIGVDARGLGDERIQRIRLVPDADDLHTHEGHDGGGQGRIVIKRIENGEESVEEYEFEGDHGGLPEHVRELLHRHAGDLGADDDASQRLPRRIALRSGEGREGNRMIFVPEGGRDPIVVEGERIEWTERAPAAPRRPAARAQDRLQELQQRVRQLERRIAELEQALERTAERPQARRRIRWER